jgi:hypothetical protein
MPFSNGFVCALSLCLLLAAPSGGGPLQPPDGVGNAPAIGVGRILVADARTPVRCEARVIETATGDTIAVLSIAPIGRAPRLRGR